MTMNVFFERRVRYVSFSSGGTCGFLHVGAVAALRSALGPRGYAGWRAGLTGVAGCSAGCFAALAILLDVDADDVERAFPFDTFVTRLASDLPNAALHLGASDTDLIVEAAGHVLRHGGLSSTITLEHLHRFTRAECVFVCTSLTRRRRVYLTHETHPRVRVVQAVAASCCVPGVFRPVCIDGEYLVDGFLSESVPAPFPVQETFYFVVRPVISDGDLNATTYTSALLEILTRGDEQLRDVPRHRRVLLRHDAACLAFDPFLSQTNAHRLRRSGLVQTLSAVRLGCEEALRDVVRCCVRAYVRNSISVDLTTTDEEAAPPFPEGRSGVPAAECGA